ncbi:sirohydrochlorin chelatase [Streptomyces sp. NPDC048248]|uniref:sirohydrochlorin chelatase n=1 Tax=Streptomyces sp. NPDC048248 TaxID=3365523 RepID=UPI00371F3BA8
MTASRAHQPIQAPIDLAPNDDLASRTDPVPSEGRAAHQGRAVADDRPAPDDPDARDHPDSDHPDGAVPLGTADLATEITAQLSHQLSKVRLHGYRRPAGQRPDRRQAAAVRHPALEHRMTTAPRPHSAPTLVAVAHGSRDPRAVRTIRALLDRVRALRPGLPVRLGHIELNQPLLADTLAALRGEAVLVPLLFGRGHHVTHDLPAALADAPHLDGRVAAPLGPHPLLIEALHGRLVEAGFAHETGGGPDARDAFDALDAAEELGCEVVAAGPCAVNRPQNRSGIGRTAVVLASAGSRAPRSAEDTARIAQLLSARLGGVPVLPAYASAATPTVAEAVRLLTARGHDRIAVAACFTAPGRFAAQCAADAPATAAAPLGDHPSLARLVLHRYDQALLARTASDPEGARAATVAV